MEIAFIVIYGALVALVMPYIIGPSEHVGSLVPGAITISWGVVLWGILTWTGLPYNDAWIWVITMFTMPAVLIVGTKQLEKRRVSQEAALEASLISAPRGSQPAGNTVYEVEEAAPSKLGKLASVKLPKLGGKAKRNKDADDYVA